MDDNTCQSPIYQPVEGNSESVSCEFFNDILETGWILHCCRDGVFRLTQINCQCQNGNISLSVLYHTHPICMY